MEKGLRQGDPLSPFMFLVAAEGLHSLTTRAVERDLLKPAEIGNDKIRISHLQYADDTIFIMDRSESNMTAVKHILSLFQWISGLAVNYNKSSLMGIEIEESSLIQMADVLNCKVSTIPFNYLGIKVGGRCNKVVDWSYLVDKVKRKVEGWKNSKLSLAGRCTLVKSVLQAIPIYQLSFSPIPKTTVRALNSIFCRFLLGGRVFWLDSMG